MVPVLPPSSSQYSISEKHCKNDPVRRFTHFTRQPFLPKFVKALGALFLSYLWLDGLEWDCMQGPLFLFPKPRLETRKNGLGTDPMAMPFGVKYIAFKLPLTFPQFGHFDINGCEF